MKCTLNKAIDHHAASLDADVDHPDAPICGVVYDPMDKKKGTFNKWIDWLEDNWGAKDATDSDDNSDNDSDNDSDHDSYSDSNSHSDRDSSSNDDDDNREDAYSANKKPSNDHFRVRSSKLQKTGITQHSNEKPMRSPRSPIQRGRKRIAKDFADSNPMEHSNSLVMNHRNWSDSDPFDESKRNTTDSNDAELETVNLNKATWPNMRQILIDQKEKLQERADQLLSDFDAKHQTMLMELNMQRNVISKEIQRMVTEQQALMNNIIRKFDQKFAAQNKKIQHRDLELRISKVIGQERAATQRLLDETKRQFVEFKIQPFELSICENVQRHSLGNADDVVVLMNDQSKHLNRNDIRSSTISASMTNLEKGTRSEIEDVDDSLDKHSDCVVENVKESESSRSKGRGKSEEGEDEDAALEILRRKCTNSTNSKVPATTNSSFGAKIPTKVGSVLGKHLSVSLASKYDTDKHMIQPVRPYRRVTARKSTSPSGPRSKSLIWNKKRNRKYGRRWSNEAETDIQHPAKRQKLNITQIIQEKYVSIARKF